MHLGLCGLLIEQNKFCLSW